MILILSNHFFMLFGQALEAINSGKKVRRAQRTWSLSLERNKEGKPADILHTDQSGMPDSWVADADDLLAGDWEVC